MVDTDKFLEQLGIYKNFIEDSKDKDEEERKEEIEEIMDEYRVDGYEAEEIIDIFRKQLWIRF